MAPNDSKPDAGGNVYGTSGGGDKPQTGTRSDTGITSSGTRATNEPTQDVTGTAAEGAPGTGTDKT